MYVYIEPKKETEKDRKEEIQRNENEKEGKENHRSSNHGIELFVSRQPAVQWRFH